MPPNAATPSGGAPAPQQGTQGSRAPLTALSLLLVAAAVQLTSVAPSAVRWLIVAVLLLLASASAVVAAIKVRKLDPALLNELTKERNTVPGIITYYVTRSVWITFAVGMVLLAGSGGSAYWSYHVWRPPAPSGAFLMPGLGALSSYSGQYLVSLHSVRNISSDLIWFEVAVPQYTASYAQTYLCYYTQASGQYGSAASYDAIVDIANYAEAPTVELLTAFACNYADSLIESGASHPEIRKQAGCYSLAHVCVRLPPCAHTPKCNLSRDVFELPGECRNRSIVWLKQVAPLS